MKKILFIATGGTIASGDSGEGLAPVLTSRELLSYVPKVSNYAEIEVVQPFNLDSTNLTPSHWVQLAQLIKPLYTQFDGFVIAHGTDTLAYGAAALSCLIQHADKPIVMTGSQRPMSAPDTDAKLNLSSAFLTAADGKLCGVMVVFGLKIIDGRCAKKVSTRSFSAFRSINCPEMGTVGGLVPINPNYHADTAPMRFYDKLSGGVMTIKLTPEMPLCIFDAALSDEVRAVIIEGYGAGGLPDYGTQEYEKRTAALLAAGKHVIMTTQVPSGGTDLSLYKVGREISDKYSIIDAGAMTTEYAVMRAMWALANADGEFKKQFLGE